MVEFSLDGSEAVRKSVSETGTGAHVFVPKEWRGEEVVVIRLAEPSPDSDTADRDAPSPLASIEYDTVFDPSGTISEGGKEIAIEEVGTSNVYAGKWPRQLFENSYTRDEPETWIGYGSNSRTGLRAIPVDRDSWFRHTAVFGNTGFGKTTLLKTLMVQWAYGGYGFCFIDPKGEDVTDLLRQLPEHRLKDVLWVDPTAYPSTDRVIGFNFLQPGIDRENRRALDEEANHIVDELRDLTHDGTYWGARMDGILSTICRCMIRSEKPYTLVDMYCFLDDETYRQQFSDEVDEEVVRKYSQIISEEMEQRNLNLLLRRIKKLVESRVTREVIAHKDSTVTLNDAIDNGRILLVKNDAANSNERELIANGIMRRIWAAAQVRATRPKKERTPYHMVIDGADEILGDSSGVERMLSKARSMRLSFTLCCQQPSQLPEETQKAIFGHCDTLLAMNPSDPHDAEVIMKRFGEYDAADLLNLGRYEMFTRLSLGATQSDPFVTHTFADYPPLRSVAEAEAVKERSLRRYGKPHLDPDNLGNNTVLDIPA